MATKPLVRILDWANVGSTTDPGTGKENTGWLVSERPPANWWNWILNSFGQWLRYLEQKTDEGVQAYGRVAVDLTNGNVTVEAGALNIVGGVTGSTNRLEVVIGADLADGWVGTASTPSGATSPVARILTVDNTGGTNGAGAVGTRSIIIEVFSHDGTQIDIDGGGTGTMRFDVVAVGVPA